MANPVGDIIIIGYSMGGLIARDMIVNGFSRHRVSLLITLGTPNLGYPWVSIDRWARCEPLARQMFGDFLHAASEDPRDEQRDFFDDDQPRHRVALSDFLYQLNTNWRNSPPDNLPLWMAAAGTFCDEPVRISFPPRGCPTDEPWNDGVVCEKSAGLYWNMNNSPDYQWDDRRAPRQYAHTSNPLSETLFCGNWTNHPALFDPPYPPEQNGLLNAIKEIIELIH